MASRDFVDADGRDWTVWDVRPMIRYQTRPAANFSDGWLAFKCNDGEQRRLAPIPAVADGWESADDGQLRRWCGDARCIRNSKG